MNKNIYSYNNILKTPASIIMKEHVNSIYNKYTWDKYKVTDLGIIFYDKS